MTTLTREKLRCPKCNTGFYTNVLGSYGTMGSYSDFCPIYTGAPALFNLIVICPMCDFTAYMNRFEILPRGAVDGSGQWDEKEEPASPFGPLKFLKAVDTYKKEGAPPAVIADLYLKAFWCFHYGEFKDADKQRILSDTIFLFQEAIERLAYPKGQENEYKYLLGELSRRAGRFSEAVEWFEKLDNAGADPNLIILADRMRKLAAENDSSDQTV
jgi:hypothetical protein